MRLICAVWFPYIFTLFEFHFDSYVVNIVAVLLGLLPSTAYLVWLYRWMSEFLSYNLSVHLKNLLHESMIIRFIVGVNNAAYEGQNHSSRFENHEPSYIIYDVQNLFSHDREWWNKLICDSVILFIRLTRWWFL